MPMKANISLCMIVRNEELQLEKCLNSIRDHVEEICIVDTGSIDKTPSIAKQFADKFEVYTDCNDSDGRIESFSDARQRSFSLATKPWVMWIDGDDEVRDSDKLAELVASYNPNDTVAIMLPYEYAHDDRGNVTVRHYRERIVSRGDGFKWVNPVHEVLIPTGGSQQHKSDQVTIVHRRGAKIGYSLDPQRNLRILKKWYEKHGESDARQLYYLGLEYGNNNDRDNAIKFLSRYVDLSGWDDEQCLACIKVSDHYQAMGKTNEAIHWATRALSIKEDWSECFFALSRLYYYRANSGKSPQEIRDWQRCIHFAKQGLSMPPTQTLLFLNPVERAEIYEYLNFAQNKIGDIRGALESCDAGLKLRHSDKMLLNQRLYGTHLTKIDITNNLQKLVGYEYITDATKDKLIHLIHNPNDVNKAESAPVRVVQTTGPSVDQILDQLVELDIITKSSKSLALTKIGKSFVADMTRADAFPVEVIPQAKDPLDIVVYVGCSVESWCPTSFNNGGLGGSETAVIEMTRRFAAAGNKVRVFGDCISSEGTYDGVQYINYGRFKDVECDVFITSRQPHVVDDAFNLKAKIKLCWVHDIHCGSALTHNRALRIDKFLCLSKWHKDHFLNTYKYIHESQVIVTRNGIDLNRFNKAVRRNPHRVVYSSSPDRGLQTLLDCWPKIRESVSDAELHIFYGFNNWEASAKMSNDQGQLNLIETLKNQIDKNKDLGVVFHGRVNQQQLAEEYLSSGVWAYSTWFVETSCISAMEAHAAGLHMITSPIAALNETVGPRGTMINGDWRSEEYKEKFTNSVIDALLDANNENRKKLQQYAAENFSWGTLATEWTEMFHSVINEVQDKIVPPYKGWMEPRQ